MESEAPFDKTIRRVSEILGLCIAVYMVSLLPPVKKHTEALQRDIEYKVRYCLRWLRNQQRMPWEKELIGETEEMRRIVLPQVKPKWYKSHE